LYFFSKLVSNTFSNILEAFLEVDPETKLASNKILYNFALRYNSRIKIDFELHLKLVLGFE
jgi:hypothetical protein